MGLLSSSSAASGRRRSAAVAATLPVAAQAAARATWRATGPDRSAALDTALQAVAESVSLRREALAAAPPVARALPVLALLPFVLSVSLSPGAAPGPEPRVPVCAAKEPEAAEAPRAP